MAINSLNALTSADQTFQTVSGTNVTITSPSPPSGTIHNIGWSGQLAASLGGTGLGSYAVGDLLAATATTPTLGKISAVATGQVLTSQGVNTLPAWSGSPSLATLTVTGNVGIGTTGPTQKLHVSTTVNADGAFVDGTTNPNLMLGNAGTIKARLGLPTTAAAYSSDAAANDLVIRTEATSQRILFNVNGGGASAMAVNNGNVGIGTVSPVTNLDVRGTNAKVQVGSDSSGVLGPSQTGYGASNATEKVMLGLMTSLGFVGTVSNTGLSLLTNNSTKVLITGGGNVGIGTMTPSSLLHVAAGGGIQVGAPTGGNLANSVNVSGGYFINGVAVSGAPSGAQYVTLALDGGLSGERVLGAGTGLTLVDGGANGSVTVSVNQAAALAWTGNHSWTKNTVTSTPPSRISATVSGDRTTVGAIAIPAGTYGSGGPGETTFVSGQTIVGNDTTNYTASGSASPSGNVGAGSAASVISASFGTTYSGIGIAQIIQSIDTRNPVTTTAIEQDHSNVWSLLVANSAGAGPGQAFVNSINALFLTSRLSTVNSATGLVVTMSNFAAADGRSNGIVIGAGDQANAGTEFINGDALQISNQNPHTGTAGFTNAIRVVFPDHSGTPPAPVDLFLVRNDGSVFLNVPSTGAATVLDVRRNGLILMQLDNSTVAAETSMVLNFGGTLYRVKVGASGSCAAGAGRCLYIDN